MKTDSGQESPCDTIARLQATIRRLREEAKEDSYVQACLRKTTTATDDDFFAEYDEETERLCRGE